MVERKSLFSRYIYPLLIVMGYTFIYLPIFVLIIFSFNKSKIPVEWTGFSLKWYAKLFSSSEIINAFKNSMIVALASSFLSVMIGTCLVVSSKWWRNQFIFSFFMPNLFVPDIIVAIGILNLFSILKIPLGLGSLIVGHTLIGLIFVIQIVKARYLEIDPFLTEASLDLGATYYQTFRLVLFPLLKSAIVPAALITFTLSLDDYLIALFCSGPEVQTLSVYTFVSIRSSLDPTVNALATCMLAISSIIVIIAAALNLTNQVIKHD